MFIGRVIIVTLMCATVVGAQVCNGTSFVSIPTHAGSLSPFRLSGIQEIIPVTVYALILHQSIPVLVASSKERGQGAANSLRTAFFTCSGFYISIGLVLALYFGSTAESQCNLAWEHYVGCLDTPPRGSPPLTRADASWWAIMARCIVLLFPAVDVMTACVARCGFAVYLSCVHMATGSLQVPPQRHCARQQHAVCVGR